MTEIWKQLPSTLTNSPNLPQWEISTHGHIRDEHGNPVVTEINGHGYRLVVIPLKTKVIIRTVHSVVLETFVAPPIRVNGKVSQFCNHKDWNKLNNRLDNLEYVTQSENALHGRYRKAHPECKSISAIGMTKENIL